MSSREVIVQGTIHPDGTLELDHKLHLAPGKAQVIVQPLPAFALRTGLAEVIQKISQDQLARGDSGRTVAEQAAEDALRQDEEDDYEARCRALWGQTQTGQPR